MSYRERRARSAPESAARRKGAQEKDRKGEERTKGKSERREETEEHSLVADQTIQIAVGSISPFSFQGRSSLFRSAVRTEIPTYPE